jgi:predicted glycogen debranching enzyme
MIERESGALSLIAGYPWFGEWGRDAMIALPGLAFCSDNVENGKKVMRTFIGEMRDGLLPNFLTMGNTHFHRHAYNAVDASLWFFFAAHALFKASGNSKAAVGEFIPAMKHIIDAFLNSSNPLVKCHENGLLWAGNENTQLSWMDAAVEGVPVTSRYGYAVELNALWYFSLAWYCELTAREQQKQNAALRNLIKIMKVSFRQLFWLEDEGFLADVINDHGPDRSVRPNQIFAASLSYSPLTQIQKRKIVAMVAKHLLTPFGLRTLSPGDPKFHEVYGGEPKERDRAYHQGTVWPWLVGSYVEASLAVSRNRRLTAKKLLKYFTPLYRDHLAMGCLEGISEIFNATEPYIFKGCIHQAWSVGETIRALSLLNEEISE